MVFPILRHYHFKAVSTPKIPIKFRSFSDFFNSISIHVDSFHRKSGIHMNLQKRCVHIFYSHHILMRSYGTFDNTSHYCAFQ